MTTSGGCKVCDFGLAKVLLEEQHIVTKTLGTVSHMPPELILDNILSPPADVYAWGILVYQTYMGKSPWHGFMAPQIVVQVAQKRGKLPRPEGAPQSLIALFEATTSWNAESRPSFEEIIRLLYSDDELSVEAAP